MLGFALKLRRPLSWIVGLWVLGLQLWGFVGGGLSKGFHESGIFAICMPGLPILGFSVLDWREGSGAYTIIALAWCGVFLVWCFLMAFLIHASPEYE